MTSTTTDPLKARHRTMWGLGDYPLVADTVIPDLGAVLVDACGVKPGDHVLDVAAGSGNAAIPAARAGAQVVASDLTPSLLEAGKARAEVLPIRWEEADAEALPYADGSFEHVLVSSDQRNVFMVIVLDLTRRVVYGHHLLNLNELYGVGE